MHTYRRVGVRKELWEKDVKDVEHVEHWRPCLVDDVQAHGAASVQRVKDSVGVVCVWVCALEPQCARCRNSRRETEVTTNTRTPLCHSESRPPHSLCTHKNRSRTLRRRLGGRYGSQNRWRATCTGNLVGFPHGLSRRHLRTGLQRSGSGQSQRQTEIRGQKPTTHFQTARGTSQRTRTSSHPSFLPHSRSSSYTSGVEGGSGPVVVGGAHFHEVQVSPPVGRRRSHPCKPR